MCFTIYCRYKKIDSSAMREYFFSAAALMKNSPKKERARDRMTQQQLFRKYVRQVGGEKMPLSFLFA